MLDTHLAAPCLLGAGLNWPTVCCIVFQPCFVASKLTVLDWMLMAAIQLEIVCDGAQLRPTPWPSFSTVHEATAGWCFNLLVLPQYGYLHLGGILGTKVRCRGIVSSHPIQTPRPPPSPILLVCFIYILKRQVHASTLLSFVDW